MDAVTADLIRYEREENFRDSIADEVETRIYNMSASDMFDRIDEHFANTGGASIIAKLAEWYAADKDERICKANELRELMQKAMEPLVRESME